jgi:hypothetical protein
MTEGNSTKYMMKQDLHIIPEGHINATSITTACRRRSGQQESRGMISGRGEAAGYDVIHAHLLLRVARSARCALRGLRAARFCDSRAPAMRSFFFASACAVCAPRVSVK